MKRLLSILFILLPITALAGHGFFIEITNNLYVNIVTKASGKCMYLYNWDNVSITVEPRKTITRYVETDASASGCDIESSNFSIILEGSLGGRKIIASAINFPSNIGSPYCIPGFTNTSLFPIYYKATSKCTEKCGSEDKQTCFKSAVGYATTPSTIKVSIANNTGSKLTKYDVGPGLNEYYQVVPPVTITGTRADYIYRMLPGFPLGNQQPSITYGTTLNNSCQMTYGWDKNNKCFATVKPAGTNARFNCTASATTLASSGPFPPSCEVSMSIPQAIQVGVSNKLIGTPLQRYQFLPTNPQAYLNSVVPPAIIAAATKQQPTITKSFVYLIKANENPQITYGFGGDISQQCLWTYGYDASKKVCFVNSVSPINSNISCDFKATGCLLDLSISAGSGFIKQVTPTIHNEIYDDLSASTSGPYSNEIKIVSPLNDGQTDEVKAYSIVHQQSQPQIFTYVLKNPIFAGTGCQFQVGGQNLCFVHACQLGTKTAGVVCGGAKQKQPIIKLSCIAKVNKKGDTCNTDFMIKLPGDNNNENP